MAKSITILQKNLSHLSRHIVLHYCLYSNTYNIFYQSKVILTLMIAAWIGANF